MGLFAGLMAALGGFPLAVINTLEVGRFSMFLPYPVLSTALVVALMLPFARKLVANWVSTRSSQAGAEAGIIFRRTHVDDKAGASAD